MKSRKLPAPLAAVVGHTNLAGMHLKGSEESRSPRAACTREYVPRTALAVRKAQPPLSSLQGLDGRLLIDADHDCVSRAGPSTDPLCPPPFGRTADQCSRTNCGAVEGECRACPAHARHGSPIRRQGPWPAACPSTSCARPAQARPNWARMRRSVPSSYTRGLPGRGASARPLNPCLANRVRHLLTVAARVLQLRCDILRRASRRRFQHDTGSLHKALLSTRSAHPPLQRRSLLLRQFDKPLLLLT